ncbi:phage tail assembly protein T [Nonomuraea dietziae]|uniref:phage tail assembly protein T n=1 Tax=Nonomuraea dietziae TaxID=65515 RepID=UPI00341AB172
MPVAQLLKQISGRELAEWKAFEELYGPVGVEQRVDRAAAVIAAQLANTFRGKKTEQISAEYFMPRWDVRPIEGYGEEGDGESPA